MAATTLPRRPVHGRMLRLVVAAILVFMVPMVFWVSSTGDSDTPAPAATAPTTPTLPAEPTAVWPFPGGISFADPDTAARSFALTFLGFTDPVIGDFQRGDSRSGEVPVQPLANGPITTIFVRQLSGDEGWSVLGAATADIQVTSPQALETITSPVRVTGSALAFEGNVLVEVRADGDVRPIGSGYVTGGGDVLRPFEGTIEFDTPTAAYGSLVFYTTSAENGRVWEAGVLRVAFPR